MNTPTHVANMTFYTCGTCKGRGPFPRTENGKICLSVPSHEAHFKSSSLQAAFLREFSFRRFIGLSSLFQTVKVAEPLGSLTGRQAGKQTYWDLTSCNCETWLSRFLLIIYIAAVGARSPWGRQAEREGKEEQIEAHKLTKME